MKIVPHLWFDREAREAALFYVSLFDNSTFFGSTVLEDTPSGDAESVHFELAGQPFEAISAGPEFKLNPSISLMVSCASKDEVDRLWRALSDGGNALMELGEYPFSRWYGWIQDRYGLSWQLMLVDEMPKQKIKPSFLFAGPACGKAEEAVRYYAGVFPDSEVGLISRYAPGEAAVPEAKVNYIGFKLMGQDFVAMDHGYGADFTFNEAFSLMVQCEDQKEIDFYGEKLSHVPEAEACGWLKDRFGVSWQIVPAEMGELFASATDEQVQRLTQAFLQMKKLDIAALRRAVEGR
jgi:predicted 3-demethylubiquinone-9 3-methyltransferase (glyoxalase superfamily)